MRRRLGLIAAGAAAFLLGLIVRFPARWAALALPGGVVCEQVAGTLWSGTCAGLVVSHVRLGDLAWTLHPLQLLVGRLDLDVALMEGGGAARARLVLSPAGAVSVHGIHATFPLDRTLIPELPPGTGGTADVDLASLNWNGMRVTEIRGEVDVRDLTSAGEPLGSYRLLFPGGAGDELVGRVSDLGGPFALQATVHLTREPGYVIEGLIAARPSASPDLAAQLRYLGAADSEGRRQFSVSGTF
jgi:hypothetical protein